jgi:hypothetical protein
LAGEHANHQTFPKSDEKLWMVNRLGQVCLAGGTAYSILPARRPGSKKTRGWQTAQARAKMSFPALFTPQIRRMDE